ncbi:hypothetical protein WJX74_009278 [Apatococcus lobatus]|uniref:Protein SDA1 n=1 Tax=Apatococcus lobatus TaxID=904363 RepID=A0AAW1S2R9_9CHLO
MVSRGLELLTLQGAIKRDPDGYADEFRLQFQHYQATLDILSCNAGSDSKEFEDLIHFVAQVAGCYPAQTAAFPGQLISLLDTHYAALSPSLRTSVVKALILLRHRNQVQPMQLLPLFFRLFRCQDKALRHMIFHHIIADLKACNRRARNDRLNRAVQSFLYTALQDEHEGAAKKSLAVLTELYRRQVWRDARTVNVIASATFHSSPRIMLAALKFFLGQDQAPEGEEDESSADEEDGDIKALGPTKAEFYKANKKGTVSSKKKKKNKLKRVVATVKKAARKDKMSKQESFAAVQLLHDPQYFAEKLLARLQKSGNQRFETRLAMMRAVSRVVGVHRLILLNFYPFLQKYIRPHQHDVTHILAALIQATHDQVPPDVLEPVLRQLVDQFIHDRARPAVMTVGIKTVRELCARSPLIMTSELLQDLVGYKKFKDKEVSSAARGLAGLFRELAPSMLAKKDRGRGADLQAAPLQYGANVVSDRIMGADLLQADLLQAAQASDAEDDGDENEEGAAASDDEVDSGAELESDAELCSDAGDGSDAGSAEELSEDEQSDEEATSLGDDDLEAGQQPAVDIASAADGAASSSDSQVQLDDDGDEEEEDDVSTSDGDAADAGSQGDDEEQIAERLKSHAAAASRPAHTAAAAPLRPAGHQGQPGSLSALRKQLAAARALQAARAANAAASPAAEEVVAAPGGAAVAKYSPAGSDAEEAVAANILPDVSTPIEWGRILSEEDFARIKELRHQKLVAEAMQRHGLKSAGKRARLESAAEDEAEALLKMQDERAMLNDQHLDPLSLEGQRQQRKDKAERMASVLKGREGREFGAAAARKKQKTGGLSNKQKEKAKAMPSHVRMKQISRRAAKHKQASKGFKGRNQDEPAEAQGRSARQQYQASQGASVLKINVDLGLWRGRVARHKAQHAQNRMERQHWQAESERILLRCLQLDPLDARSYVALGKLYMGQQRLDEAARLYEDGCAATEGSNCYIWQSWAVLEQRRGNISKSRQYFEAATIAQQDHAASWHGWGQLERQAGNQHRARDLWLQGIRNTRHRPSAHLYQSLAILAADMSCAAAARKWFEEGTRLLEGSRAVALWQAWGLMEQRLGNADQARTLFQQGLESLPYNRFLLLAHGQLEREQGNVLEARRLLRFGLKNNPLDAALMQALACLEADDNEVDIARQLFRRGTELHPQHLYLWQAWGVLEFRQGNLAVARQLFQQGVWADPASRDVAFVWQAWALLEIRCSNVTLARRMFQCAMRADPRSSAALESWIAMEDVQGDRALAEELRQRQQQDDVQVVQPSNIAATFDLDAAEAPLQALFTNVRNWMNKVGSSSSVRSRLTRAEADSNFLPRPAPATLAMDVPPGPAENVHAADSRQNMPAAERQRPEAPVEAALQDSRRSRRPPPAIIDKQ